MLVQNNLFFTLQESCSKWPARPLVGWDRSC